MATDTIPKATTAGNSPVAMAVITVAATDIAATTVTTGINSLAAVMVITVAAVATTAITGINSPVAVMGIMVTIAITATNSPGEEATMVIMAVAVTITGTTVINSPGAAMSITATIAITAARANMAITDRRAVTNSRVGPGTTQGTANSASLMGRTDGIAVVAVAIVVTTDLESCQVVDDETSVVQTAGAAKWGPWPGTVDAVWGA